MNNAGHERSCYHLLYFSSLYANDNALSAHAFLVHLMQSTQVSTGALCNMLLILRRRENLIHHRRNRPQV